MVAPTARTNNPLTISLVQTAGRGKFSRDFECMKSVVINSVRQNHTLDLFVFPEGLLAGCYVKDVEANLEE